MSTKYITVMFSCSACGIVDAPVKVRARRREEDVAYYVGKVIGRAVSHEHQVLSKLRCEAKVMKNLKIPLDDTDPDFWIGKWTPNLATMPPVRGEDDGTISK